MEFVDRLHTALFENVLAEMASFTLPEPIPLPGPDGKTVYVKYLDMRWEDYSNLHIRRWGQWTPFTAKLPHSERYLIWNGIKAWISTQDVPEYYTVPEKWWEMAQGMDLQGFEVLKPKMRRGIEL